MKTMHGTNDEDEMGGSEAPPSVVASEATPSVENVISEGNEIDNDTAEILRSWERRAGHLDEITAEEFEAWKTANALEFGSLDVEVNLELLLEFFASKKHEIRCNANRSRPSISIEKRIKSKDPKEFNKDWFQYMPHEGETPRLFFSLLLDNLPLETVKPKTTKHGLLKPKTTTLDGFFKEHFWHYKEWLGEDRSLSSWQNVTEDFLRKWCPPGKKNGFKWDHVTEPFWTLSETECRRIAFVTTYQFATAVVQYWPLRNDIW